MKRDLSTIKLKGFSIIEAIIAVGVFSLIISGILTNFFYSNKYVVSSGRQLEAISLAEEGLEAVRNIRDNNFSSLIDGIYGISTLGNAWSLSDSQDLRGDFTRKVYISSVDQNIKEIKSEVTWIESGMTKKAFLSERLSDWRKVKEWGNPSLGQCLNFSGGHNNLKIKIGGNYAYSVSSSGSANFNIVEVSNPSNISQLSSLSINSNPSNISISGNYAYVSSSDNNREIQVVNISNPATASVVGNYNASGNADANSIDISGSVAYLVRSTSSSDEFYTINISNPNSPSTMSSLNLNSSANDIIKIGNYAFIATNDSNGEIKVINISNPNSLSFSGSYNISGNINLLSISGFGSTVLAGSSSGILYIFDISNPNSPILKSQFNATSSINDIAIGKDNKFALLATSLATGEFQVIDITDNTNPALAASVDMDDAIFGLDYDSGKDFVVTVGSSNPKEFCVILP